MEREFYVLDEWETVRKYARFGRMELAFKLNDERFLNYKNPQNKFKKHLGFTSGYHKVIRPNGWNRYEARITVYDQQKLFLFRVKYGL